MKNILVITYWSYKDALIQTYTLPYIRIISETCECKIHLVTIEQEKLKLSKEERTKIESQLNKEGINLISLPYSRIGLKMYFKMIYFVLSLFIYVLKNKITHIHGWCTPGGALAYILSVFTRRPLVLDSYEPHAEIMSESGTWDRNSLSFKILFYLEKLQTKRAKHIVSCTEGMRDYAKRKYDYIIKDNFYVKPACIDLDNFSFQNVKNKKLLESLNFKDKIIGVYAGKFGGTYLSSEIFSIFKSAHKVWGDKFRVLLLNNHSDSELKEIADSVGFDYSLVVKKFVPHSEIPNHIGLGDFGLTPFVPIPSKKYGTPIKDGEYWALGLPVIITKDISDDSEIITKHKIGYELQSLDNDEYEKGISFVKNLIDSKSRKEIFDFIRPVAEKYRNFNRAKEAYKEIYG